MTDVERFHNLMHFKPIDRLPVIEWAGWWDQTVTRWYGEGLPASMTDAGEIREHLGLDCYRQLWIGPRAATCPGPKSHGAGVVEDLRSYREIRRHLYPRPSFDPASIRPWAERHARGEMVVWITLEGFFWYPRTLLGIEPHLYAFYDQPGLMHEMNRDLLEFNLRVLDELCRVVTPDFMTFAEDMSYNHGPMLSKDAFDEFLAPYYRRITPVLHERGIVAFVDSDGDVTHPIEWFEEVGVEGILPLERMAGVDVAAIRRKHPRWKMIGAFDKTVMKDGEAAMRREFDRLLPVMRQGGFIPAVDHQTPPDVSLATYGVYVGLLREYCERAAREMESVRTCNASLREFRPDDLSVVAELVHRTIDVAYAGVYPPRAIGHFHGHHTEGKILADANQGYTVVAERDGRLVATGTLVANEIQRMYVDPSAQGQGLGTAILRALEARAREEGTARLQLYASVVARRFYEELGYVVTEEGAGDVGEGQVLRYFRMAKAVEIGTADTMKHAPAARMPRGRLTQ